MLWNFSNTLLTSCCFAISTPIVAQPATEFIFDHYGPQDGLLASEVFDIIKSKQGYIWLATDNGLVRYNGHSFKSYTSEIDNPSSISHDYVSELKEDRHGRIWVVAGEYLNILLPEEERILHIPFITGTDTLYRNRIVSLCYDEEKDRMWISTNRGLFYHEENFSDLKRYSLPGFPEGMYPGVLVKDGVENLWLANTYGLFHINYKSHTFQLMHRPGEDPLQPDDDGFITLYRDDDGILWLGNWVWGLFRYDPSLNKWDKFHYKRNGETQNTIYSITAISHLPQQLVIGTMDGLRLFDKTTYQFTNYSTENLMDSGNVPGSVYHVSVIGDDELWIGSSIGFHKLDFKKQLFLRKDLVTDRTDVLPIANMQIEETSAKDSILWFHAPYLGIFKYDLINNKEIPSDPSLRPYTDPSAGSHTIYLDSRHRLWISSVRYGISSYDISKKRILIPSITAELSHPTIMEITGDLDGNIWISGFGGIWKVDEEKQELIPLESFTEYMRNQRISSNILSMSIDTANRLWFVAGWNTHIPEAVICYTIGQTTSTAFKRIEHSAFQKLRGINHIRATQQGTIYVSGDKGFVYFNPGAAQTQGEEDIKFVRTPARCTQALEDHLGRVWFSTQTGIYLFDPLTENLFSYSYHNSGIGKSPTPALSISSNTNQLFIGHDGFLKTLDLNRDLVYPCGPPLLTDLIVNGRPDIRTAQSGEHLSLRYDQNTIQLEFSNLSYTNPELNRYWYKLSGAIDDWQEARGNNINLNNLGPGKYPLHVRTTNAFGTKGSDEFLLHIAITPPFWRTWLFNILIILMAVIVIFLFYRYRLGQLERLNKIRLSISRDLHDDMGGNLSQVKILSEIEATKSDSNPVFQKINTKLGTIMDNMSEIVWSINPQKDDLSEIILHIQEYAVETLEPQNINLHFKIDSIPDHIRFNIEQRRHFYLIFKEAINNIAKYGKAGNVTFSLQLKQRKMHVSITDDGIGFDSSLISRGNGLRNMKERALMLKGELKIATSPKGTTVALTKVPW